MNKPSIFPELWGNVGVQIPRISLVNLGLATPREAFVKCIFFNWKLCQHGHIGVILTSDSSLVSIVNTPNMAVIAFWFSWGCVQLKNSTRCFLFLFPFHCESQVFGYEFQFSLTNFNYAGLCCVGVMGLLCHKIVKQKSSFSIVTYLRR